MEIPLIWSTFIDIKGFWKPFLVGPLALKYVPDQSCLCGSQFSTMVRVTMMKAPPTFMKVTVTVPVRVLSASVSSPEHQDSSPLLHNLDTILEQHPSQSVIMPSKPKANKDSTSSANDGKKGSKSKASGGKSKNDSAAEGSSSGGKALKPATAINARHILVSPLLLSFQDY